MSTRIARLLSYTGLASLLCMGCSGEPAPSVTAGQSLYAESGCGSCHGASGSGDGPVAAAVDPRPTDLHQAADFKTPLDEAALAQMLAVGIAAHQHPQGGEVDAHHNQGMPPFAHLSETERRSLALYVISLNKEPR